MTIIKPAQIDRSKYLVRYSRILHLFEKAIHHLNMWMAFLLLGAINHQTRIHEKNLYTRQDNLSICLPHSFLFVFLFADNPYGMFQWL